MTTAPDLPVTATWPALSVVPPQPFAPDVIEFDDALRRAVPRLKRYAARRLLDEHEAEEVVQEAMLRAFQHRHELATDDDLMAWLTVVTGRLVIDRLRVRGRTTPVAEIPPESRAGRDTADVVVARDEARIALDALEAMPSRQAGVLWAREVEGLSYDEIGERYSMTEPTVRSVLHRARRTLRREYAARGGTLPAVGLVALAPWLHGMRATARLRTVARRAGGAAAVTATGLAVVTVVPFHAHTSPIRQTPAMTPALRVHTVSATQPARHPIADPAAAPRAAVQQRSAAVRPESVPLQGAPRLCGTHAAGEPISAGCATHHSPTIYLRLPVAVAGNHEIGVSNDRLLCAAVPATPLSECDASTSPSKRNTP